MANILATQYNSVFSRPRTKLPSADDLFNTNNDRPSIFNIDFSEKDIEEAKDGIKTTASAGPDGFPAMLLKQCKKELSKPLYMIWRSSLDSGKVSLLLKRANIIPIHKGIVWISCFFS